MKGNDCTHCSKTKTENHVKSAWTKLLPEYIVLRWKCLWMYSVVQKGTGKMHNGKNSKMAPSSQKGPKPTALGSQSMCLRKLTPAFPLLASHNCPSLTWRKNFPFILQNAFPKSGVFFSFLKGKKNTWITAKLLLSIILIKGHKITT